MKWKNDYFMALDQAHLFENDGHRTRFKELMDCYAGYPFFSKGLCKCIYMSAWDEEHFMIMLETLTEMTLGREQGPEEMLDKGDSLAVAQTGGEYYLYQLSIAFLEDKPFVLGPDVQLTPEYQHIMERTLQAAAVIDQVSIHAPH